jgi:hypothetical protein
VVFIHCLGEIRDRTYENRQHPASGLSFIVTATGLSWRNTGVPASAFGSLARPRMPSSRSILFT